MIQFETKAVTRIVITTANESCGPFRSRLYVNKGETATLVAAKHSTEAGARKWAANKLAA